jgi:transposase
VVAPWARRTRRLAAWLIAIGLELGGAAGVRLSRRLGCTLSRQTLLRMIRRLPLPCGSPPQVLGVDDFAFRKRQTYGTVLIDLERRQAVALLPDRTAEALAQWLQKHPGVEVIARDRSKASADGAHQGASEATQVADRFHLLQNRREALDQVFTTHGKTLDAVNDLVRQQPMALPDGTVAVPVPHPDTPRPAQRKAAQSITAQFTAQGYVFPKDAILVARGPLQTQVRYFHCADAREASQVAALLTQVHRQPVVSRFIAGYEDSPLLQLRHYEVWLAPDPP